jgi:hypothetical protein
MIRSLATRGLLLLALTTATAFAQSEVEPNNTIAQANVLASPNMTVTGSYSSGVDVDFYRFTLNETSAVSIRIWGPLVGVCPSGVYMDPTLTLYDSGGQQIATSDDTLGTACPLLDTSTAPIMATLPAGTYSVAAATLGTPSQPAYSMVIAASAPPAPIVESFTYQGKLDSAGTPVNGAVPMRFSLWNSATSQALGSRLSLPIQYNSVEVLNGLFTVDLNFTIPNAPANYDGTERYLRIEVGDLNGSGGFTTLEPRQRLSPTPHAIVAHRAGRAAQSTLADTATNAINATTAVSSTYAQFSTNAGSVDWIDVAGKPQEFADGEDANGGWNETLTVTHTFLNVGINTSSPGSFDLAVSGTAAKTGGGSWAVFSDERLKHDIKPMAGTLDRLLQLRGYTYEYNTDAVESRLALPGTQIGLMAQEVERVFPDWVAKDEQGFRYVTERSTTALMVEALRDLRAEKDTAIQTLRDENSLLKARLDRLENALLHAK